MKAPFLLKLAYSCWGIPLALAFISFFGYWISRSDFFLTTGMVTLLIGFTLACTGLIIISIFRFKNRKADQDLLPLIKKGIFLPRLLLILNFPTAILFIIFGTYLHSLIYLHISNESSQNIDQLVISSVHNSKVLGSLKTGASITTYFSPRVEGEVLISVRSNKSEKTAKVTGYASGSFDDSKVVIKDELNISILKLRKIKDKT